MGYEVVTYDTLGNERHKAVCELRKLSTCSPTSSWFRDAIAAAIGVSRDGAPYDDKTLCKLICERLIHLLGGDLPLVNLSDLFGIWKDGGDDVRGSVAALGDPAVRAAAGRGDDIHTRSGVEGLAPITTELRNACGDPYGMVSYAAIESHDFDRLCDAIDAVHTGLERENAELRRQLDSLLYDSKPMTDENMAESGWVRLPLDADGVPIRIGDVMEWPTTHETFEVVGIGDGTLFYIKDDSEQADWTGASTKRHHHAPTVEDVLRNVVTLCHSTWKEESPFHFYDVDDVMKSGNIAEYAAKLRLAGDAE